MNHRIRKLAVTAFLAGAQAALAGESADSRQPVPPSPQLKRAEGIIKSLFKDDYARQAATDRQNLAGKLLTQGLSTANDPSSQYVCYREARDLATLGGDLPAAFTAINALAKEFAIEPKEIQKSKVNSYITVAKQLEAPDANVALTELGLYEVNGLITSDDYDDADRLMTSVDSAAKKSKQLALVTRSLSIRTEITDLRHDAQKATLAAEQLKKNPEDREANLTVGKHLGFVKGVWGDAVPLLAKSSDPNLRHLSQLELAKSTDAKLTLQLADGWWAVAEKQSGIAKSNIEQHAREEYVRVYPNLAGADAQRVAARVPAGMLPRPIVASAPNSALPPPVEPARTASTRPAVAGETTHFWFDCNMQPPGTRVWHKIDADNWQETNPGGAMNFRFVARDDPQLGAGMVVGFISDPALQVFVPEFIEGKGIYFRRTDRDSQWHRMGAIHLGEPPAP